MLVVYFAGTDVRAWRATASRHPRFADVPGRARARPGMHECESPVEALTVDRRHEVGGEAAIGLGLLPLRGADTGQRQEHAEGEPMA